jgi:hypothetical protein
LWDEIRKKEKRKIRNDAVPEKVQTNSIFCKSIEEVVSYLFWKIMKNILNIFSFDSICV